MSSSFCILALLIVSMRALLHFASVLRAMFHLPLRMAVNIATVVHLRVLGVKAT